MAVTCRLDLNGCAPCGAFDDRQIGVKQAAREHRFDFLDQEIEHLGEIGSTVMAMDWVQDFFRDVDAFKIELLGNWFADDMSLRFANNPAINDKQTALMALGGFFQTIKGLQHRPETILGEGNEATQMAIVTYTRLDGTLVPLQVASYLRRNSGGKLDRLWIYIDLAPLFSDQGEH